MPDALLPFFLPPSSLSPFLNISSLLSPLSSFFHRLSPQETSTKPKPSTHDRVARKGSSGKGQQWQRVLWALAELRPAGVEVYMANYSAAISAVEVRFAIVAAHVATNSAATSAVETCHQQTGAWS